MATQETTEKVDSGQTKLKFTKAQLVKSQKYYHRRDAISALLSDDKQYTFDEVDEILKQFYKGGKK